MNHPSLRSRFGLALLAVTLYAGGWLHGMYARGEWSLGSIGLWKPTDAVADHTDAKSGHGHEHGDSSHGDDPHDHDDHEHHDAEMALAESNSLEVSEAARKNLGLSEEFLKPIELRDYQQVIRVPSIVVDRPGRTRLPLSAGMTGLVTHVHVAEGEAVEPGDLILEMRLTHEDLVTAQRDFLQSLGERDIELKEIARLERVVTSGAVSSKTLLERQYNRDKLDSLLRSQRESLRLHGLTDEQIVSIENDRRLLSEIRVYAPGPDTHPEDEIRLSRLADSSGAGLQSEFHLANYPKMEKGATPNSKESSGVEEADPLPHLLVLQDMHVQKGQMVTAGEILCTLADYQELLVEGQAFEVEANLIRQAKIAGWETTGVIDSNGVCERIPGLMLTRLDNEIDPSTRTLKFYVALNNSLLDDAQGSSGERHVCWKFRVGQRMELGIPIAQWKDQIVLPIEAVVREGLDSYVFQENGNHFDRVAVHEKFRDQSFVVIEHDGALFPGDVVALRGAHQMQMALKSRSGGAVDPHAGHSH